jgi:hypothetical protein
MARLAYLGSIALVALACATLPACGQQDETQRILAQCSDPPPDQIDSCLEQARVQEETDPSPDMQKLVASLIKRQVEARNAPQDLHPLPPPPDDGSDPNAYEAPPAPPPPSDMDDDSGSYVAPPDAAPQETAPPAMQGDPAAAGDQEDNSPPPPSAHGDPQDLPPENSSGPHSTQQE